jgi:hypothetical protein
VLYFPMCQLDTDRRTEIDSAECAAVLSPEFYDFIARGAATI